ncbi:magnesium transporter [Flavobacteriaceae bacterium MAR_2010_188]|nr:magnesium transporter [Flavobacteriaceae bacterium MAR_2010_188]
MGRFLEKNRSDIGRPPDEIYFRGQKKIETVLIRLIDYDKVKFEERTLESVSDINTYREQNSVTWLNIDGLHNIALMEELASVFNFDPLIIADVMNTSARPKVHEYENAIAVSIKMLQQNEQTGKITVENLSLIMTKTALISFQEKKGDVFEPIRERIKNKKKRIRNSGTDFLAFALLDIVIDNYIFIISILGDKIEGLEENFLRNPQKSVIDDINRLKQELNFLRKNINPAKEMILALSKMDSEFIKKSIHVHYKELVDNINQAVDTSNSYREILTDQLNIYHTTISSKLNDVMKLLTVFSVIFIPLTFIVGVYGTNFDVLPELHYQYSYYIMWALMIVVAIGMLIYFKRKKWL